MKFYLFLLPVLFFVGCGEEPIPEPVPIAVEEVIQPEPEPIVVLPKSPLTKGMINKYSLSSEDISKLQLYISNDIDLQRSIPASSSTIEAGILVVNKEDRVHRILIKKGTPCIATQMNDNYIRVSFSETLTLTFMYTRAKKDLFLLSANKWKDSKGSLVVNGEEYQAIGTSGQSYLMLNKTDVDNSNNDEVVVEGSLVR